MSQNMFNDKESPYDLDKNISIRACAGAGKTYTLTWRYIAILNYFAKKSKDFGQSNWYGPANILVITFTRKATAELKSRIIHTLNSILYNHEIDPPIDLSNLMRVGKEYIVWLKKQLINPNIMTIDSFCMSILRENPLKSQFDPNIKIMNEYDSEIFYNDSFTSFFLKMREENKKTLVINFGTKDLKRIFIDIAENQLFFEKKYHEFQNINEMQILKKWKKNYPEEFNYQHIIKNLNKCSELICMSNLPTDIKKQWIPLCEVTKNLLNSNENYKDDIFRNQLLKLLIGSNGKFKKRFGKTGSKLEWKKNNLDKNKFDLIICDIQSELKKINPDDIKCLITSDEIKHIKLIQKIIPIFKDWILFIEKEKDKQQTITYKDLLFRCKKFLLKNEKNRRDLSEKFKHIMVDEFQDTTYYHWEIIKSVFSKNDKIKSKGLFIVGDEKQSIYRFNNSDVTTFNKAISDMKKVSSTFNSIELNWNFRSTKSLINKCINPIFNLLFSPAFNKKKPYQAVYQKTKLNDKSQNTLTPPNYKIGNKSFFIDLFFVANKFKINETKLCYYDRVAKIVQSILKKSKNKTSNFVGILLRAVKPNIGQYSEAFRKLGIKVEIASNSTFYQSQEVSDIEMLISVILNPKDDIALCGLLKSPIFSFKDTKIHSLISNRNGMSIYEKLSKDGNLIINEIDTWISDSKSISVNKLIESIIHSKYRELAFISEPNGEKVWGNLKKIISIIHNWSNKGDNLEQIRRTLRENIISNTTESNFYKSDNTQVVLMSIHKAKGLAFPYVIIPELHRKFSFDSNSRLDIDFLHDLNDNRNIELGLNPIDSNLKTINYALSTKLKRQRKKELFEEYKRLLYVAITRAKYGVILSGKIYEKNLNEDLGYEINNSKSWMDWFRKIYSLDEIITNNKEKVAINNGPDIKINYFTKKIIDKSNKIEKIKYSPLFKNHKKNKLINSSVTALFKSYKKSNKKKMNSSIERGILIHKILEKNWIDYSKYEVKIKRWLKKQPNNFYQKINSFSIKKYNQYLSTLNFLKHVFEIDKSKRFNEIEVQGTLISLSKELKVQLSGVIDVLYESNTSWYVLDYKTGVKEFDNNSYENQIQAYLHLVKHCFNIKAKGQIYYLDEDRLDEYDFNPYFFKNLNIIDQNNFSFIKTTNQNNFFSIPTIDKNTKIIVANKKRKVELWNHLVFKRQLKPNIKILTFDIFKSLLNKDLKEKPSRFLKRYAVKKIFAKKNKVDLKYLPGLIDLIVKTFDEHVESGADMVMELYSIYPQYKKYLNKMGFNISEKLDIKENNSLGEIVFDNQALVKESDIQLFENLKLYKSIKVIEDFKNSDLGIIKNKLNKNEMFWYSFLSIDDEINFIFNTIKDKLNDGFSLNDFSILIPEMDSYLFKIEGFFRREGISLSIRKSKPLSENNEVKAFISLLKILQGKQINWIDLKTFLMSKLNLELKIFYFIECDRIYDLDILLRRIDKTSFSLENLKEIENIFFKSNLYDEYKILRDGLEYCLKYNLQEFFTFFIDSNLENLNINDKVAINKMKDLISEIYNSIEKFNLSMSDYQIINEIIYLQKQTEYSNLKTDWGVEIVSVMDGLNLQNEFIFFVGLNRETFPIKPKKNPFFKIEKNYHENANTIILHSLLCLNKNLFFSYCTLNENQEILEPTIFMDNYKAKLIKDERCNSTFNNELLSIDKIITTDIANIELNRVVERHNAFVKEGIPENYFGRIDKSFTKDISLNFSSTSLDELYEKPYFYFLKRIWNLNEIDKKKSQNLIKGNFIHKLFEVFGKNNGWNINRKNQQQALRLFERIKTKLITEELNEESSLFELFCREPSIFLKLFQEEIIKTPHFFNKFSEVKFGENETFKQITINHSDLGDIFFNGKIDRIDFSDDGENILVQDFKTGNIKWNNIDGDMSRQLFLYYLVIKNNYPNSKICVAYRQIKNLNNIGFKNYFLFDTENIEKIVQNTKNNNKHIKIDDLNYLKNKILECFKPINKCHFPLFSSKKVNLNINNYYYLRSVSRFESIKYLL